MKRTQPVWASIRRKAASPCQRRRVAGTVLGMLLFWATGTASAATTGILREVWTNLGAGTSIADLTNNPAYPDYPTSTNLVTDLFEAPTDVMDDYGQRMVGYVVAPQTGNYTFWIASDDNGELWLSTDDTPAHAQLIANVTSWTSSRQWDKEPNQQSAPIPLVAGHAYYIAALMKEGSGGDNLAVRWRMPDGTDQAPMVATNLVPWGTTFTPTDIGEPSLTGVVAETNGVYWVSGSGQVGGTADQLQFAYQERDGDFDVRARLANVAVTDPFLTAGWMVRESLATNAQFAAAFASSAQIGCFFESRSALGATTTTASPPGGFAVNYPETWLRLQRSGTTVTGYGSLNGVTWYELGEQSFASLPTKLYLGFAVASANNAQRTTAEFHDVGNVTQAQVGDWQPQGEPLGPSSRRTGMIFSEIMYHPAPRTDGRNLQFVELYNARAVFEDLSGWRLEGDVHFQFPAGFTLQAGAFVVVAAVPSDVRAVYGITNVIGPFTGSLPHNTGKVQLDNASGAVRLEVNYSDQPPWPAAADGAGPSLVLARPSFGEGDPRAWSASARIGGSPGLPEAEYPTPLQNVVINEFLAHTDDPQLDFIELYNHSNAAVDLSGCVLTDDASTNRFRIPLGTSIPARGFLAFDQNQLSFRLSAAGETIYFFNPDHTAVLDAIRFGGQENGVSSGRCPDGAPTIRRLANPTPGAANSGWRSEDVVINELMYHPISDDSDDEYVELYNRTAHAIDLGGWQFTDGIDFTFAPKTVLGAHDYLVVARNAARLISHYPQLNATNTVGDFRGKLSNSGEHVALAKPDWIVSTNAAGEISTNLIHIVVAEVTYGTDGRWGQWADGGGSSLELIDPAADPLQPASWADSDETQKAPWTTATFTGVLDNGNGSYAPNRLHLGMLGAGECLVDDVEVMRVGSTNLVGNAGFEDGATRWSFFGNHTQSTVQQGGAASGGACLHVIASGHGDTGVNSIRTPLYPGLGSGTRATIQAKVRWLAGWPELLFRLSGNWLEMTARMQVPTNLGTPGLPNSRLVYNAGPAIYDVTHWPPLPASRQSVRVTCRVSDPDGLKSVTLLYRLDPNTTLNPLPMLDDGTGGDEVAGDGVYTATLPGQRSGTLVAFRLQATDANGLPATSVFPAHVPQQECLVRWGDPIPTGNLVHYHLWSTRATEQARNASPALDNTYRDATLVYGDFRVIYDVGFRDKGSPYHAGAGDFAVTVPMDDSLLGTSDRVFASTGNGGSEATAIRSQLASWFYEQAGVPYLYANYMLLYRNGSAFRNVMEDLEEPDRYYAHSWFPQAGDGDLYKVAEWFEFQDDNLSFSATSATLQKFTTTGGAYKLPRYRWIFQRRPNDGMAGNYTNLFNLVTVANVTGADYVPGLLEVANLNEWMRVFACARMMGDWDMWSYNVGQNMFLYKLPDDRWNLMRWDIDFTFGLGDGTNAPIAGGQDPVVARMYNAGAFRRMLWRAYVDQVNGPMLPARFQPQIDARRQVLLQNHIPNLQAPIDITSFLIGRRAYLQGLINYSNPSTFALLSTNSTSDTPTLVLTGNAPFVVATITVNGEDYPINWPNWRIFQITVPLTQPTTVLNLVGWDEQGNPVPGATTSLTVTYTGALERMADYVRLNEIQYNPTLPGASFIELYNRSTNTTFDLSGCQVRGVGYTFPSGAVIPPDSYLLLVKDRAAFAAAHGADVPVFDEFPGSLNNAGEYLALEQPDPTTDQGTVVSDVRYGAQLPWPTNAAGLGPSLQLIDPAQSSWRVGNWAATATNAPVTATPGHANTTREDLVPFPPVWLNEVLPDNTRGLTDNAGQADPWIELYNAGSNTVDLSPYYLTDSYTNLTQWAFPAGTSIGPQGFLLVWADGEPAQSVRGELHTNFRLAPGSGSVALVRLQGAANEAAVMDYLDYVDLVSDESYGSVPDGEPRNRRVLYYVTPGATNNPATPPLPVFINEWMAGNTQTLTDPTDGHYDDWFELYNSGQTPVDLSGCFLTDTLTNWNKFTIPPGTILAPRGFLLVWADEDTNENGVTNQLHTNFKLSRDGEAIGLFGPDGTPVDMVTFGPQTDDVSEGRWPDGAQPPFVFMTEPTPGAPNIVPGQLVLEPPRMADGSVILRWRAAVGTTYRLEFKNDLNESLWQVLTEFTANQTTAAVTNQVSGATRFYRVIEEP